MGGWPSGNPDDRGSPAISGMRSGRGSADQLAEQAASFRPMMNFRDLIVIEANGDELDEEAVITDNAQRAISGVNQTDSGGHDAM